ncbi:zinc finger CCHC domain-containing protein 8 [Salvia hispanica]|uniref:zinc finger CCHC domain-containing protein 8 n=1 Tax=Salvia hispanica TaxID=49212 RepID=UPI0020097CFB|nr:zinc finger CCHC domain-containing protein 8 [Salvia hispanica]XP_047959583.1 zinc finger CCHC domain-containing protein 8 [Salvia hispanica]
METEDLIKLPASSNSEHGDNDNTCESGPEAISSESLHLNSEVTEEINGEDPGATVGVLDENMDALMEDDFEGGPNSNGVTPPVGLGITDSVANVEKVASVSSMLHGNGFVSVQSEISVSNLKKNEVLSSKMELDAKSISGVKRPRAAVDEYQPSVHVIYSSLPRESKQKLEKLLEQWSQWHSEWSSSSDDSNVVLESGEETYFPALRIGGDKPSSITFWVDSKTKMQSSTEFKQLDSASAPLYDREYSSALTSTDGASGLDGRADKLDASRCFNCGSYGHALKDCSKPRDNAAVNSARKQQKVKRNQHPNSRNSTRYYQTSRGGKYDGLTPGVLNGETKKALGLGDLDPPPWLKRMREIGYPPGYLDAETEDQPSGITIFGDDTYKDENEEGEILDASYAEPLRKMTVEFPGLNAPVPENADERLWASDERLWASNSLSSNPSRYSSHQRYNQPSETSSRGYYSEQRRSRDWDDEGPPGCEPGTSPSLSNHFHRYGDLDSGYKPHSPRDSPSTTWSSSYARSLSDRGRRSPLHRDGSPTYGYYGSYASPR